MSVFKESRGRFPIVLVAAKTRYLLRVSCVLWEQKRVFWGRPGVKFQPCLWWVRPDIFQRKLDYFQPNLDIFHRILEQCLWQQKQVFLGDLRTLIVATNHCQTTMFPNHIQVVLTLNEALAYLWFCKDALNKHLTWRVVCSTKVTPCPSHILTLSSMISSLSSSGSQASPCPSLSRSSCPEFGSMGQLSYKPITDQFSEIPSMQNTVSQSDKNSLPFSHFLAVIRRVLLAG